MKVFLETYGCQMNEYDSELIRSILTKEDFVFVKQELDADVVMLNTCAIRENAHRKVYGRVHDIRNDRRKKNLPNPLIGILGCMATNLRQDLLENESLDIDFIAGPDSYKRLPALIEEAISGKKAFDVTLSEFETYSDVYPYREAGINPSSASFDKLRTPLRVNAWIAVMRGCDNFCTFCVVPYTRGRERSRSVENILEEVKRLADSGYKQITLLGQNVNSYRHNNSDFADLLTAVSRVSGIERIRFTSPHPKDFPDKLITVVTNNPKVCKHIHLPLQAGNDRILDLMKRTYTQREFLDLVKKIRTACPGISLSTDAIVGFPTETRKEFEDTVKVIEEVQFDSAFIFRYSQRKNTVASRKYPDDISGEEKKARIMRLQDIQKEITFKKNASHIGKVMTVLIEDATSKGTPGFIGRTDGNRIVSLTPGEYTRGEFIDVQINSASPHVLRGTPVSDLAPLRA